MTEPPSRDAILDAGENLFAERGYRGATVQALGQATGLSPALLYYYFGSKEGLYEAVLDRVLGRLAETGLARTASAAGPAAAITALLEAQAEALLSRPTTARLFLRELVDERGRRVEPVVRRRLAALFERLTSLIAAGQRSGAFRPDLDPPFAAISTASQVAWFAVASPVVALLLGHERERLPAGVAAEYAAHAARFALSALEARPFAAASPQEVPT